MARTDWTMEDYFKANNMNELGEEINQLRTDVDNIEIPPASLTTAGITRLSNSTTGVSETVAATEKAVSDALTQAIAYVDQENLWGAL
ncbi:phage tail protein [Paenibacillus xylanexedens]|uniref:phage tail protein n=1 Tax=Paenibacillus xylanexedens TaxID=528191 RepID=UPI0011A79E4D|nr:phage tail protein [Paenibacillus xylanexedens]